MDEHDEATPTPEEGFPAALDHPGEREVDVAKDCDDRETLEAHETAECAGERVVKEYDNEEDGGS